MLSTSFAEVRRVSQGVRIGIHTFTPPNKDTVAVATTSDS